ncbi:TRAP transporter, 4TM/12TM fusion protein [Natronorubrum sediminis]|uniref:TRAP transporter, 4TM/12TM fusion protein n=1 Tax=Natronorubrum sediminis TaxID=640943 RepID=A0A1H6G4A8_9EURY|nr:TRAP transporter fused permease subunit [Natronorubrum sediminis]SEH17432.1 TRAP transporter, 4TM/12TM fusion protein [Natronorubrum sediminis]
MAEQPPADDTEDAADIDIDGKGIDIDDEVTDRPIREEISNRLSWDRLQSKMTLWSFLALLSVPFWLYVMWMAYLQSAIIGTAPSRAQFGAGFLGGVIVLYALYEMIQRVGGGKRHYRKDVKELVSKENRLDTSLLLISVALMAPTVVYIYINALDLAGRGGASTPEEVMALSFTLVMIYITWRAFGATFLAVLLAGIAYGLFGSVVPGTLSHTGISPERTLRILVISMDGFFGFLTQLTAAWIALFLLYAGLLKSYGAFELILRVATRSAKYIDSGVAQTAVIASAVIGSVNGSQTANAGMTGSFTIPMMKKSGVKPATAGGIESVASTSGQVLPPVMGAGAFVMAQLITGASYLDVIVAGLIPAAILMVTVFVAVHYAAGPQIEDPDMDELYDQSLTTGEMVLEGIKFGVPIVILVYLLGVVGWTVGTSAFWTVITMITLGMAIPTVKRAYETTDVRETFWAFVYTGGQTINGFREGVIVLAPVAIILASINGVVDIFEATGVPGSIALALMDLSGGVLLIAAILAMIICIILGLGMPTTAAYTIVAMLVAPTLVEQFMLPEFSGHFFVFYAAILAGLTPPIATCVAVATGIAGSNFWRTCFEGVKISAPLFVLPFSFIYHPDIVDHGGDVSATVLMTSAIILFGGLLIIHGLNYRFDRSRVTAYGLRAVFFGLGVTAMVYPETVVQLGALGVGVFLFLTQAAVGESSPLDKLRGSQSN